MNLVICTSPLHVLIAEKIIDRYPDEEFVAILQTWPQSIQMGQYYQGRLQQKCRFVLLNTGRKRSYLYAYFKILLTTPRGIKRAFVTSSWMWRAMCLLNCLSPKELQTFDDGTHNIIPHQNKATTQKKNLKGKLLALLQGKYTAENIPNISKQHYTIYSKFENIATAPLIYLPLFEKGELQNTNKENKPPIHILLGQPVDEFVKGVDAKEFVNKIIKDFQIELYFPHPREWYKVNCTYAPPQYCFEDYYIKFLGGRNCIVYTFFSTAALNLYDYPNVKIVSLKPNGIEGRTFLEVYRLFEKLGIEIKDLPYDEL